MEPQEIERLVQETISDAEVRVSDLTGTGDHFEIVVVSDSFRGKTLIEQHQLVQASVKSALDDGRIHAIQIRTATKEDKAKRQSADDGLRIVGE